MHFIHVGLSTPNVIFLHLIMLSLMASQDIKFKRGIFNSFASCSGFNDMLIPFAKQPLTSIGIQKTHCIRNISKWTYQIAETFISYSPSCINSLLIFAQLLLCFFIIFWYTQIPPSWWMPSICFFNALCFYSYYALQLFHTSLGSYTDPEQISTCMDFHVLLYHTSPGSGTHQRHVLETMNIFHCLVVYFLYL